MQLRSRVGGMRVSPHGREDALSLFIQRYRHLKPNLTTRMKADTNTFNDFTDDDEDSTTSLLETETFQPDVTDDDDEEQFEDEDTSEEPTEE